MIPGEQFVLSDTIMNGYIEREILVMRASAESVSVPSGNFTCSHYDFLYLSGTSVQALDTPSIRKGYFAPGVGEVKEQDYGYDQNNRHFLMHDVALQSYIVK